MASRKAILLGIMMIILCHGLPRVIECKVKGRKLVLVTTPPLVLSYHKGPLLTGPSPLHIYFLWYGSFSPSQKQVLIDFASSLSSSSLPSPSVSSWWSTASSYTDQTSTHVSSTISLAAQASVPASPPSPGSSYSFLTKQAISSLLLSTLRSGALPADARGVYFIFTAEDVAVEEFCMGSCGFHDYLQADGEGGKVVYAWVGNAGKQCPGVCAWPFARAEYGPDTPALVAPNGDVGMEGMVMNMAALLAGAATNPYGGGYFQGPRVAPLEAGSACTGIFGAGAYPGYPGSLLTDRKTGVSYNAHGVNGRFFLLPALWNPASQTCSPPPT